MKEKCTNRIALRITPNLRNALDERASREGVSLSTAVKRTLIEALQKTFSEREETEVINEKTI